MTPRHQSEHQAATARHAYQIAIVAADIAAHQHRAVMQGAWDRAPVSIERGLYWSKESTPGTVMREKCLAD